MNYELDTMNYELDTMNYELDKKASKETPLNAA